MKKCCAYIYLVNEALQIIAFYIPKFERKIVLFMFTIKI